MGTVALRRKASSRCTKQKGKNPQAPCKTLVNRTYEGLSYGFWTGKWSRLGGPIAQCNSPIRAVLIPQPSWNLPVGVGAHPTWRNGARRRTKVASLDLSPVGRESTVEPLRCASVAACLGLSLARQTACRI